MWTSVSMPLKAAPVLLALTTLAFATLPSRPRPRAGLSDQAGARDHPVPARRDQRHRRPPDCDELTIRLGKQFIVDNRAGAGGVVGSELAANAPKDGYTLLVVSLVNTVNPWLYQAQLRAG